MSQIRPSPATHHRARRHGPPQRAAPLWLAGLSSPDASTLLDPPIRSWLATFQRMHRGSSGIQTRALRVVVWPKHEAGQPRARHVWEVARWSPRDRGWTFICWALDEPGLWMKRFDRLRDALGYLRQEPNQVMAAHPGDAESSHGS